MPVVPSELDEVTSVTPAIRPSLRSSGIATAVAIVVGEAPGRLALTLIVGMSTRGSGATGSWVKAAPPASRIRIASSDVAIGRLMNGADRFTRAPSACACIPSLTV